MALLRHKHTHTHTQTHTHKHTHTHTQIYIDMRVENRESEYADIESAKLRLRERYL